MTAQYKTRLALLERVYSFARRYRSKRTQSRIQGAGVDFGGQRPYVLGDDFRNIDWKAKARLDRWIVKVTEKTQERKLDIVIDSSDSMTCGDPHVLDAAAELALCLSAFGLGRGIATRCRHHLSCQAQFLRGRDKLGVLAKKRALRSVDWPQLSQLLLDSAQVKASDTVLISDGFWPENWPKVFQALGSQRRNLFILLVYPQFEFAPEYLHQHSAQFEVAEQDNREQSQDIKVDEGLLKQMSERRRLHIATLNEKLKSMAICTESIQFDSRIKHKKIEALVHSIAPILF